MGAHSFGFSPEKLCAAAVALGLSAGMSQDRAQQAKDEAVL